MLYGTVTGCHASPPRKLRFYTADNVMVAEATTDDEAAFTVQLPAGQYRVTCDLYPCTPSPVSVPADALPVQLVCSPGCSCCKPK